MKNRIIAILGIIVILGGVYYVSQRNRVDVTLDFSQQTSKTGDPFQDGFKAGETNFLAQTKTIQGVLGVSFGA